MNILDLAQEFATLNELKKDLTSSLDEVKTKMSDIEAQIAEQMLYENPRIRVKIGEKSGGQPIFRTVHVSTTVRATHNGDKEALVEGMKAAGLDDMISETYNANTLSAFVRGFDPDKSLTTEELLDELPEEMRPHVKLTKVISLGCRA